jgi:hypothetical protein
MLGGSVFDASKVTNISCASYPLFVCCNSFFNVFCSPFVSSVGSEVTSEGSLVSLREGMRARLRSAMALGQLPVGFTAARHRCC